MTKIRKYFIFMLATLGVIYTLNTNASSTVVYKIRGLNRPLATQVETRLGHSLEALTPPLTSEAIRTWNNDVPAEIQHTLSLYGYFKPTIHSTLHYQNKTWQAIYTINPGPALKITHLKVSIQGQGSNNQALKMLMQQLSIHQGDIFSSPAYEETKQKLLSTSIAEGYLSAYFSQHRVLINQQSHTAQIDLVLVTGLRYYFGPINFEQTTLKDSFLRRYLPFKTGDPYSSKQLLKLQDNLNRSGYFKHVSVSDLKLPKQNQQIPILFKLKPRPSQQYMAGIGYSTDFGIKGTLGWESRYLNQFGHKLIIHSQFSKPQDSLQTTYIIPGGQPNTDNYNINFAIVRKRFPQVNSTIQQIGVGSRHQWKGWRRNLFLNYQIERFNYIDRANKISYLLTPGITLSRNQFDKPIYALHGYRINLRVQGADKNILSSTSFLQAQLQGKYIFSWNENSRVILRSDLGYTIARNTTNFPPSLLFYAGGTLSIRGYDYQKLGPGRYLMVGSAEYQHKIINNFYGAVFLDLGNAVNNFPINPKKGLGVGIVCISPVGPIEVTLARAMDLPNHPMRLQLSLGIDLL